MGGGEGRDGEALQRAVSCEPGLPVCFGSSVCESERKPRGRHVSWAGARWVMREAWCDDTSGSVGDVVSAAEVCARHRLCAGTTTHTQPAQLRCRVWGRGVACLAFPLLLVDREYVDGRSIGSSEHRPVLLFAFTLGATVG